jgi:hypothetical protein
MHVTVPSYYCMPCPRQRPVTKDQTLGAVLSQQQERISFTVLEKNPK